MTPSAPKPTRDPPPAGAVEKEEPDLHLDHQGRARPVHAQRRRPRPGRQVKDVLDEFFKDWDYTLLADKAQLTLKIQVAQYLRDQAVNQSVETIRNRVDQFGVAEPIIQRQGNERIIVELPGVDNPERVMDIIKTTAMLEWKLVKAGPAPDEETLLKDFGGKVPDDMEVVKGDPKRRSRGLSISSARSPPSPARTSARSAGAQDEWNNPAVAFTLKPDGARRFEQATGENIGKTLAIVLDRKIQSPPVINTRISGDTGGIIQGNFHARRGRRPGPHPQSRAPCRRDQDPREPDDRPLARRGFGPGRPSGRSSPFCSS